MIQILCDQKPAVRWRRIPGDVVVLAGQAFVNNGVRVMAKFSEHVDETMRRLSSSLIFTAGAPRLSEDPPVQRQRRSRSRREHRP